MPNTYGILICEDSLDLIAVLNEGVRPAVAEDKFVYIYTTDRNGYNAIISIEEFSELHPNVEPSTDLVKLY